MKIIEKKPNHKKSTVPSGAVFVCGKNPRQYWMHHKMVYSEQADNNNVPTMHELIFLGYSPIGVWPSPPQTYTPGDTIRVYEYILLRKYKQVNATLTVECAD